MNPVYFPAEPRSPSIIRIGAPAGVWSEDLARKKGQPAYYTVTVNKGFSLQFSWKDAKGKIGASDKVKLQPDWDNTRAEFETKFRHDLYRGNAMNSFNRDLIISTGRSMLRKFAEAKGSAFPLGGEHLLGDIMVKPLTRDVDDATIAKIEHIEQFPFTWSFDTNECWV
ncbi:hypothetical protein FDENT_8972 [Fusarium denticulatum]|uniref:Uncharacterized protein n=1 Tax=Fusarium denticulatum TaxID=48507 RepID=A0A8H5TY55_9HYPO|nr:hypothetical protein FDENT_8972 [Fusarium denticulatum]